MPCPLVAYQSNLEEQSRTDFDAPTITLAVLRSWDDSNAVAIG
jgi:hypothetical protein